MPAVKLGRSMQNQVMVGDDYCVTGDFFVGYNSWIRLFDLTPERINVPGIGYHINPVLENLDTLDILNPSAMDFDETSADRALEYYGEQTAVPMFRKHAAWYSAGMKNSSEFRIKVNQITDSNLLKVAIQEFWSII